MSEQDLRETVELLKEVLAGSDQIASAALGPRSNEVRFIYADGRSRVVAIAVRENI